MRMGFADNRLPVNGAWRCQDLTRRYCDKGTAIQPPAYLSGAIRPCSGTLYAISRLRPATTSYAFGLTTRAASLQSP